MRSQTASAIVVGPVGSRLAGVSHNARTLIARLSERCQVTVGETGPATVKTRPIAFHASRLVRNLGTTLAILRHGVLRRGACACIFVDGGLGQFYTILHVTAARLTGQRLVLRHHSFEYVDATRPTFSVIAWVAGRQAMHTMLCPAMDTKLRARYPSIQRSLVLSNASLSPPVSPSEATPNLTGSVLTLGFLSNLTREKGLFDVLALARRCVADSVPARFILAGPIDRAEEKLAVDLALQEMPSVLSYVGPVYGDEKSAFFDEIDAFVFPTRYRMEAQPNVLFEAMSHGSTVLSYDRACIGGDVRQNAGFVVDAAKDFVKEAMPKIVALSRRSLEQKRSDKQEVSSLYSASYDLSVEKYEDLVRYILNENPTYVKSCGL